MKALKYFLLLGLSLAFCVLIWRDYSLLFQTDVATGIDGYYYVVQIETLLKEGRLYFPTNAPLILHLLAGLTFITGNALLSIKLGALLFHLLLCVGVGFFLQALTKNIWLSALGMFLTTFSAVHLYFLSEFVSNLGALMFLLWGAFGLVKSIQTTKVIWFIFSALALVLASFSHRSAVWLVVLLSILFSLTYTWWRYATTREHHLLFGLIVLLLFFTPLALDLQKAFLLPDWLSNEIRQYPQNPFRSFILPETLIVLTTGVLTLALFLTQPEFSKRDLSQLILTVVLLSSFLITLNPFLNHQAGITGFVARMDLLIYLQAAIAVPLLLSSILYFSKKLTLITIAFLISFILSQLYLPIPAGLTSEYLKNREKLVRELPLLRPDLCDKPLIIAKHGDQFLVTAVLGVPSHREPPKESQYRCVYWLIRQPQADYQIIFENSVVSLEGDFVLVNDLSFRRQFETMPEEDRAFLMWENPHLKVLFNDLRR